MLYDEFREAKFAPPSGVSGWRLTQILLASLDVGERIAVHGRIGTHTELADRGTRGYRDARVRVPSLVEDPAHERIVTDHPRLIDGDPERAGEP